MGKSNLRRLDNALERIMRNLTDRMCSLRGEKPSTLERTPERDRIREQTGAILEEFAESTRKLHEENEAERANLTLRLHPGVGVLGRSEWGDSDSASSA